MDIIIDAIPSFLKISYDQWGSETEVKTIIVYNFNMIDSSELIRNCGPFWEPGAFGGLLIIAIILNIINQKRILMKQKNMLPKTVKE